jgi:hypothetical protein
LSTSAPRRRPYDPVITSSRAAAALLLVLALAVATGAQILYGSITGNVVDSQNAVLPGAEVSATHVDTGVVRETVTDSSGGFLFNDLRPGLYRVSISLVGFRPVVVENVRVDVNTVRRADAKLEISAVQEAVTVTVRAALLETERASLHVTQTAREVNDLPLTGSAGRNYQSLMQVVPGATMAGEQNSAAGSPQRSISFNVNGVSRLQNNTKLDGASITYPWLPTNTAYVPAAEAIEEVSIVTNAFNAEQGMAGGAAINVILKSGTNLVRGTGWAYNTASKFRARNFFQTAAVTPKDDLNQFGANLGGPIMRNKVFFFTNWERTRRVNSSPVLTRSLATDALRRGDFSGVPVVIYDPASNPDPRLRTPFPGNVIPADRIDLAAQELIKRLPATNVTGANPFINNFTASGEGTFTRDNVDAKVTLNATSRLTFFGRYSVSPHEIVDPPALGDAGGDAINGGQLGFAPGRTQIAGAGVTYSLSSNMLFDANFGFTRQRLGAEFDLENNWGLDLLKIPGTNGTDRLQAGMPSFQVGGWANMGNPNTGNPFRFADHQYVGAANFTWLKSSHQLRFGYDYQNQQLNHFQPQGGTFQTVRGTFVFNGNMTRLEGGAAPADTRYNSWADFLLGLPNRAGKVDQLLNPNSIRMQTYAAYAQDTWELGRLTLNYGLRWELYPWPTRDVGGVSRFDPADGNVYIGGNQGVPVDTGASTGVGEFLPRVGAAFRVNDKTVVRAGYGHSSDPKPFIDFRNAFPINFAWEHPAVTFNGVTNNFLPVTTLRQGLNQALYGVPPDLTQGVLRLPTGAGTTTFPKEVERPHIVSWNAALQRELFPRWSGQVAYVGTLANGQQGFVNINASAPGTGNAGRPLSRFGIVTDINMIMPFRDTTYHAMQTELRGRLASAQVGVVYTLSRTTNYADNDGNPRVQWEPSAEVNKGPAGYDRTHNFQSYWAWELPFGAQGRWLRDGVGGALLGGFQFNGVLSRMSGTPINIVQNSAPNLLAQGSGQYPDQVKDDVEIFGYRQGQPYFDVTAFASVADARFGNAGRNPIRGPGFFNVDLGLFRSFPLGGNVRLQLRAEAINAFNHANFANPAADISSSANFGLITATTGTGERNWRFGGRLSF